MKEYVTHEFGPFYQTDSKILILGSIPSKQSRIQGFYYGHPKNRFWKVLATVLNEPIPISIDDKKALLTRNKIALWDVLASCEIHGSSDSSITNPIPNDIVSLMKQCQIKKIYTTGKKSYQLYQKYCYPTTKIEAIYLPSTSPANCKKGIEQELINAYQKIKETLYLE